MLLIGKFSFDSAHYIQDSEDLLTKKCAREHGHIYKAEIKLDLNMLKNFYGRQFIDFALIKQVIKEITDPIDHVNVSKKFCLHTAVDITNYLKLLFVNYFKCNNSDITLTIFETEKWGVEC